MNGGIGGINQRSGKAKLSGVKAINLGAAKYRQCHRIGIVISMRQWLIALAYHGGSGVIASTGIGSASANGAHVSAASSAASLNQNK